MSIPIPNLPCGWQCVCPHLCTSGVCYGNRQPNQAAYRDPFTATSVSGLQAAQYAAFANQAAQAAFANYAALAQQAQYPYTTPSEPLERAGITVGEIVGWRAWRVARGVYLRSLVSNAMWSPDEPMTGKVEDHGHEGIYAFKLSRHALEKAISSPGNDMAIGSVALWGEVIEHQDGYRAEYASILSIEDVILAGSMSGPRPFRRPRNRRPKVLAELRERYACQRRDTKSG